ncbi:MAG: MipA/OmpV family protein [Gammaproteobacteria bacterium]|nr:MipA/OmpV family protein [Gammaproteobacteria bacterium]
MFKLKKIVLATLLTGLALSWIAPSYANASSDPTNTNAPITNNASSNVVYDNLTGSFVAKHKHKKAAEVSALTPSPWTAIVAVATGITPKYPGSDTMIGATALAASVSYDNRFFLSSGQGLGVNFINTKPWIVGTSVNYSYGNNWRSKEVSGLTNPKDAFMGSVFANYTVSLYNFGIAANKTLGQSEGAGFYKATATRAVPLSQHLVVNLVVAAQYDDARYMQSLYGVTNTESSASGLSSYNTHSGWDNISYGITPMYSINKHWILTGSVAMINYLDQVAKSPLIKHNQNYAVAVGVIYSIF